MQADGMPMEGVVGVDLPCAQCGYNVRMQSVRGRCPECAEPIERSLLVLPERDATASAIRLAAWSLIVGLVTRWCGFHLIASIMLLIAARRLHHRCQLHHMKEVRGRASWFVNIMWASVVVAGLSTIALAMSFGINVMGPWAPTVSASASLEPDGTTVVTHSEFDGTLEFRADDRGGCAITVLDATGEAIDSAQVGGGIQAGGRPARPAQVTTADGMMVSLVPNVASGEVLLFLPTGSTTTVDPVGGTVFVTARTAGPRALGIIQLGGCGSMIDMVLSLVATVLYLLICRGLARRARAMTLGRHFRIIMIMIVVGIVGIIPSFILSIVLSFQMGTVPPILGFVPLFLCVVMLIVAAIWQIVASFQLSRVLLNAATGWSDLVVPADRVGRPSIHIEP